ncbi:MAG: hypothetical protein LBN38_02565 [Verrucomicrobiota bacterium]|nr:hypothetical protein [Verrucomicrobiota bacterium]
MKTKQRLRFRSNAATASGCFRVVAVLGIGALLGGLVESVPAAVPQPMVVYYGQARDEYGNPYRDGAEVILRIGTNEVTRHAIDGAIAPGVNFVLYVPVDDGRSARPPYVPVAARLGDSVSIHVVDWRGEQVVMENAVLPDVSNPGDLYPIRVTAGEDLDGDGLSDAWERELIAALGDSAVTSIHDVQPREDPDGDGQTNIDEYRAGTIPFLADDVFRAEDLTRTANGRYRLRVLTSYGRVYQIKSAPPFLDGNQYDWQPCPYALSEEEEVRSRKVEGTGDWLSFYLETEEQALVWRLEIL